MSITAKRLSGPLSATLLALAIGCGEDGNGGPSPEAPDAGEEREEQDASALAPADAGPADANTRNPLASPDAAVDDAAQNQDAQAADASVESVNDAQPPRVPTASCRDDFYQCIQRNQATYMADPADVLASVDPVTGVPTLNQNEEIIKPCIPAAEACGLFPTGHGMECLGEYGTCVDQEGGGGLAPCVEVGQQCGLFGPEADACLDTFYGCAAAAILNIFTIVETELACLREAQQCGLTPALTSLGALGAPP